MGQDTQGGLYGAGRAPHLSEEPQVQQGSDRLDSDQRLLGFPGSQEGSGEQSSVGDNWSVSSIQCWTLGAQGLRFWGLLMAEARAVVWGVIERDVRMCQPGE